MTSRVDEIKFALEEIDLRITNAAQRVERKRGDITLIVVTKNFPATDVQILRDLGIDNFGENRESEGREKSRIVLGTWHFQGQVQSNKIRDLAQWADVVHSIDNVKHISKFDSCLPDEKVLSIFLQVTLDGNPQRGGVAPEELGRLAEMTMACPRLRLEGIMSVAPLEENATRAFDRLAQIHSIFRSKFPSAPSLSAGMSGDFEEAIAHGATHVRIGSSILGVRSPQR